MSAWWSDFFDEDYALLYAPVLDPARTEAEVAGAVALLRLKSGARVLDLCCGTGRHAVPLQRRGMRVTGVDSSEALLAQARRRAEQAGAAPRFVRGDARALPLRGRFDAAICLFNSIGYGTDAETLAMLSEARRVAPRLLLEVAHRDHHVRTTDGRVREWVERDGARLLAERWIDPLAGLSRATFRIQREGRPDVLKEFRHRLYTATELIALLRRAGFDRFDAWGSFDRTPFEPASPQLLLLAH